MISMNDANNPYTPPQAKLNKITKTKHLNGIGRMSFLLGLLTLIFSLFFISYTGLFFYIAPEIVLIAMFALLLNIIGLRLKNAGYSAFWGFLILIPIMNILLIMRCLAYPTDYKNTQILDANGKIVTVIFVIVFIAIISLPMLLGFLLILQYGHI